MVEVIKPFQEVMTDLEVTEVYRADQIWTARNFQNINNGVVVYRAETGKTVEILISCGRVYIASDDPITNTDVI